MEPDSSHNGQSQNNSSPHEQNNGSGIPGLFLPYPSTFFLPDIPRLSELPPQKEFYPDLSEDKIEWLEQLYLDPQFQVLSCTLEGRLKIICFAENLEDDYFAEEFGLENFDVLITYLDRFENNSATQQDNIMDDLLTRYGEKYGTQWILSNKKPLGKGFLVPGWCAYGLHLYNCRWEVAAQLIAKELNHPDVMMLPAQSGNKQLHWYYNLPNFKKVSSTIEGRMNLICRFRHLTREQMSNALNLDLEMLDDAVTYETMIRQKLVEVFGKTYGYPWVAYGLEGFDGELLITAYSQSTFYLDNVKVLFKRSKYVKRDFSENEADKNDHSASKKKTTHANAKERACLNCGKPLTGRINKQFCGGACQRTYHRHHVGDNEEENENDSSSENGVDGIGVKENENKKNDFLSQLGPLGNVIEKFADTFTTRFAENAADGLSGKMFGENKNNGQQEKPPNNPPPEKLNVVSGKTILQKPELGGFDLFSKEFTEFFGLLHVPFRMLIWGLPANGKSSFCIKFCHAIGANGAGGLYISAEEDPNGDTMQDKVLLNSKGVLNLKFTNRLPQSKEEWRSLILDKDDKGVLTQNSFYIVYDSVSKMEQAPGLADRVQKLSGFSDFNQLVSHIYIAHAEKDGTTYIGDAGWEYEADIVIRIHAGTAYMMKNRFKAKTEGLVGGKFNFFEGQIMNPEILE